MAEENQGDRYTIGASYLLLTGIPCFRDAVGGIWMDALWHHDLVRHLTYIDDLRVMSPQLPIPPDRPGLVKLSDEDARRIRFLTLPPQRTMREALASMGTILGRMWSAIGDADVVHSGIAGWPVPLGWYAHPIAMLRRKKLVVVIESAPWRVTSGSPTGFLKRLRHVLTESAGRWAANNADLVLATHQGYLDTLATHPRGHTFVTPATWITREMIRPREASIQDWDRRRNRPVRLAFAGRMVEAKGVLVLLEAARSLALRGQPVAIDFIGTGDLLDTCCLASSKVPSIGVRDPVPYGQKFFDLIREYHGLIVPTLSDEQPRIVYDAFSQALPVIASDTAGHRDEVAHGKTGWLVAPGDVRALSDRISEVARQPESLRECGLRAIDLAFSKTHEAMHTKRSELLRDYVLS